MNIYEKISPEFIEPISETKKAIILFDPTYVYKRITIKPFTRYQSISISAIWTNEKGICACGCGNALYGRRTRWYDEKCSIIPVGVQAIINGDLQYINGLMRSYLKHECCQCRCENYIIGKNLASGIQVDHIVGVMDGGGGAWLGNYRFVCHRCHAKKTGYDNKIRRGQKATPIVNNNILTLF